MSPPDHPRQWGVVYLKGVAMGAADAVPGVSGGTIALIAGIYERLIDAIAGLTEYGPALLATIVTGGQTGRLVGTIHRFRQMDIPFLVVLGLGVLTGVATVATVIDLALHTYRALTFALFFGIILASPLVLRQEIVVRPRPLVAGITGAAIAFAIAGLPAREAEYALPLLFLIGAVAICAMVLPGISGSLVLVIVGAYDTMTGAVGDVVRSIIDGPTVAAVVEPFTTLFVFALGALVGLLSFARVVSWAIDANRAVTMTFLVGVMFGALRSPYLEITRSVDRFTPSVLLGLLAAVLVGGALVVALDRLSDGL